MEVIRNYLESMFANLPNTPDVQRAKQELYSMMEDKYTELINDGKPENEAVGIVISEFGNLDEIAETLGIGGVMKGYEEPSRRKVTHDEARQFVIDTTQHRFYVGLGVLLLIISCVGPVIGETLPHVNENAGNAIGVSFFFIAIAAGVALIIYSSVRMKQWDFLKNYPCTIDFQTADELYQEQQYNRANRALMLTIGVLLCILCFVPPVVFDAISSNYFLTDGLGIALFFILIGIGVFLIIMSGAKERAYRALLTLNDRTTVAGNYESTASIYAKYTNPTVETIMSVYWQSVTCLYLIWSFLSFDWYITWIIFPIAGIISGIIKNIYGVKGGTAK